MTEPGGSNPWVVEGKVNPHLLRELSRVVRADRHTIQSVEQTERLQLYQYFWEVVENELVLRPEDAQRQDVCFDEWYDRAGIGLAYLLQTHRLQRRSVLAAETAARQRITAEQQSLISKDFWEFLLILSEIDHREVIVGDEEFIALDLELQFASERELAEVSEAAAAVRATIERAEATHWASLISGVTGSRQKMTPGEENRWRRALAAEEELAWVAVLTEATSNVTKAQEAQRRREKRELEAAAQRMVIEEEEQDVRAGIIADESRESLALQAFEEEDGKELRATHELRRLHLGQAADLQAAEARQRGLIADEALCSSAATFSKWARVIESQKTFESSVISANASVLTACQVIAEEEENERQQIGALRASDLFRIDAHFATRNLLAEEERAARTGLERDQQVSVCGCYCSWSEEFPRNQLEETERSCREQLTAHLSMQLSVFQDEHLSCRSLIEDEGRQFSDLVAQQRQEQRELAALLSLLAKNYQQQNLLQMAETRARNSLGQAVTYIHSLLAGLSKQELRFFHAEEAERNRLISEATAAFESLASRHSRRVDRLLLTAQQYITRQAMESHESTVRNEVILDEERHWSRIAFLGNCEAAIIEFSQHESGIRGDVKAEEATVRAAIDQSAKQSWWRIQTDLGFEEEKARLVQAEDYLRNNISATEGLGHDETLARALLAENLQEMRQSVLRARFLEEQLLALVQAEEQARTAAVVSSQAQLEMLREGTTFTWLRHLRAIESLVTAEETSRGCICCEEVTEQALVSVRALELSQRLWLSHAEDTAKWELLCIQEMLSIRQKAYVKAVALLIQDELSERAEIRALSHQDLDRIAAHWRDGFVALQLQLHRLAAVEKEIRGDIKAEQTKSLTQLLQTCQAAVMAQLAAALRRCVQEEIVQREDLHVVSAAQFFDLMEQMRSECPVELALQAFSVIPSARNKWGTGDMVSPAGRWRHYLNTAMVRFPLGVSYARFQAAVENVLGAGAQIVLKPPGDSVGAAVGKVSSPANARKIVAARRENASLWF